MGLYKSIKKSSKSIPVELKRERMVSWRRSDAVERIERPTKLDRARSLGYRAKKGILLARVRVLRGGRKRPLIKKGRRPKARRRLKILGMNYQTICERRANKKFKNCEILNSYFVGKDGKNIWYEVVMVDRNSPEIKKDKKLSWVTEQPGRVYRGITSSARKSRGLRKKGIGSEKARPSLRARNRLHK
tara:strand:- start:1450 stop:2013 length:564 start_codon:yes stop_codon:yes gene_type:complete